METKNSVESPEVSPDPSPIKNPIIKQYVIVKEYQGRQSLSTPKKVKQILQKTIVKEQVKDLKSERDSLGLKTFYIDSPPENETPKIIEPLLKEPWSLSNIKKLAFVGALVLGGTAGIYKLTKNNS